MSWPVSDHYWQDSVLYASLFCYGRKLCVCVCGEGGEWLIEHINVRPNYGGGGGGGGLLEEKENTWVSIITVQEFY